MADLKKMYEAILTGDRQTAVAITEEALRENLEPQKLIDEAMIPAMGEAGRRFENEEYFVPELLLAARAMKMLEGAGFKVVDLGADVSPDKFVTAIRSEQPQLVCMSALLTVTMPSMKTTMEAINAAGVRDQVKVLIGGAPVTPAYASEIGADGYADNASSAVAKARELVAA